MYTIQANTSGTRSIEVSDEHLATIQKYGNTSPPSRNTDCSSI